MMNLPELMAERYYDACERIKIERITHAAHSNASITPSTWSDLSKTQKLDRVEAMRVLLRDKQIMDEIVR